MKSNITSYGRICYVEPNAYDSQSNSYKDGDAVKYHKIADTQIIHDYEDYEMAVDLLIETRSRYAFQSEISESERNSGRVLAHFIGGHYDQSASTWYLTTEYSDYDERTIIKGMNHESIGIKSINISYESWFKPVVQIDFVDVRGASFMLPQESSYVSQLRYEKNNNYNGSYRNMKSGSFFSSLLSFPPPCFYLRVKGFYGNAVTFKLCLYKNEISFDHQNGNFDIKTTFSGYQYAMLTDIPYSLTYLAPKTATGEKIFKNSNLTFSGRNSGTPIPTADKFYSDVEKITKDNIKAFKDEESVVRLKKLQAESASVGMIVSNFPSCGNNWIFASDEKKHIGFYRTKTSEASDEIKELVKKINKSNTLVSTHLSEFNNTLPECLIKYFKLLKKKIGSDGNLKEDYSCIVSSDESGNKIIGTMKVGEKSELERIISNYVTINDKFKSCDDGDCFIIYIIESDVDFILELEKLTSMYAKKIEELTQKVDECALMFVENKLGYRPSIKNINSIIFAGLETFMGLFFYYLKRIWEDTKNGKRKIKSYVSSQEDCDVNMADSSDLPPFPLFTKTVSTKDGQKKVMLWPSEYNSNLASLPEVDFVYELLVAAETNGINKQKEDDIIKSRLANDNNTEISDSNVIRRINGGFNNFYPSTIYDLTEKNENPYSFLISDVISNELDSWLYSTFMCRDVYVENTIGIDDICLNGEYVKTATEFGAIEANNAYIALRNKYTYTDVFKNEENTKAFHFNTTSSDNMFKNLKYCWVKTNEGDIFLPIGRFDENSICDFRQVSQRSKLKNYFYDFTNLNTTKGSFSTCSLDTVYSIFSSYSDINTSANKAVSVENLFNIKNTIKNEVYSKFIYKSGYEDRKTMSDLYDKKDDVCIIDLGLTKIEDNSELKDKTIGDTFSSPIFLSSIYYEQTNILSKAYLFLMSIRSNGECGFIDGKFNNGCRTQLDLLCEGAQAWRNIYYEKKEKDPIINGVKYGINPYTLNRGLSKDGDYCLSVGGNSSFDIDYLDLQIERRIICCNEFVSFGLGDIFAEINKFFSLKKSDEKLFEVNDVYYTYDDLCEIDGIFYDKNTCDAVSESGVITYKKNKNSKACSIYDINESKSVNDFRNFDENEFKRHNEQYKIISTKNNSEESKINIVNTCSYKNGIYYLNRIDISDYSSTAYTDINKKLYKLISTITTSYDINLTNVTDSNNIVVTKYNNDSFKDIAWREFKRVFKALYNYENNKDEGADNRLVTYDDLVKSSKKTGADSTKSNDIRLNTYLTLKYIYERWICSTKESDWKILDESNAYRKFKFLYIDSYYKEIGDDLIVTLETASGLLNKYAGKKTNTSERLNNTSINTLIGNIVEKTSCMYLSLPFMFGQSRSERDMCDLFDTKPINQIGFEDQSTFVIMYAYKPSSSLDTGKCGETKNDGFDLADSLGNMSPTLPSLLSSEQSTVAGKKTNTIPAFGVTYARQGQSYFKTISLNTNIPNGAGTQYTIMSQVNIASEGSDSQKKNSIYGQELYRVFSNYSYICKVTMLGDAMISPLMYFQLNNIPMWKGAYIITKVTHSITPGNMDTNFEGYRISKFANKIIEPLPVSTTLLKKEKISGETSPEPNGSKKEEGSHGNGSHDSNHIQMAHDVLFSKMSEIEVGNNGERNANDYAYFYSIIASILADECKNKEEMESKFDDISKSTSFINGASSHRQGYSVIRESNEGGESYISVNPNGSKELNDWMSEQLTGGLNRNVTYQKENIDVDELCRFLSNYSNFQEGDLVMYWYQPSTISSETDSDGYCEPIIGNGSDCRYPCMTQVYHNYGGHRWFNSEKTLDNDFYYINTKIRNSTQKVIDVKRKQWTIIVYGCRK